MRTKTVFAFAVILFFFILMMLVFAYALQGALTGYA